ncbi:Ig-like domain-containing protein [Pseudomonas laurylsulfatiphila]|uniref:Ig-like domain-containing protein n=1 Tax=Pseudomonas laurylsulfatiphila TaxID=2011015 RepID=UPI003D1D66DB
MTTELKAATAVSNPWKQATLFINGKKVEWDAEPVLLRGRENEVTVEDPPESSPEINLGLPVDGGLNIVASPDFGKWVRPVNGKFNWKITPEAGKSGRITLVFFIKAVVETREHRSLVISSDLADEVTVLLNGDELPLAGADIPSGGTATLTLAYKSPYLLPGIDLALDAVLESGLVPGDLTSQPPLLEQTVNHEWVITAAENKIGTFKLKLLTVEEQAVLLTPSNRLFAPINTRFESFGGTPLLRPPEKNPSDTNTYFSYRVALTSLDGQPLVGVPVTFYAPGSEQETIAVTTDNRGRAFNLSLFQRAGVYTIRAVAKVAGVDRELEVLVDVVAA